MSEKLASNLVTAARGAVTSVATEPASGRGERGRDARSGPGTAASGAERPPAAPVSAAGEPERRRTNDEAGPGCHPGPPPPSSAADAADTEPTKLSPGRPAISSSSWPEKRRHGTTRFGSCVATTEHPRRRSSLVVDARTMGSSSTTRMRRPARGPLGWPGRTARPWRISPNTGAGSPPSCAVSRWTRTGLLVVGGEPEAAVSGLLRSARRCRRRCSRVSRADSSRVSAALLVDAARASLMQVLSAELAPVTVALSEIGLTTMSIATGWCGARYEQRYSVAQQRELHTRRRHPAGYGAEAGCPEGGRGGFTQRSLGHSMDCTES